MIWPAPEKLSVACFRFTLTPTQPMELPVYKGGVLRGGFGVAFKRLVCVERNTNECTPCALRNACPYGYVFETSPPDDSALLKRVSDVPSPFVLEPPIDERTLYQPGQLLSFDLLLIGRGIAYLPYFLVVFQDLGRAGLGSRRAQYQVRRVDALNPLSGRKTAVFVEGDEQISGADHSLGYADLVANAGALSSSRLTLRFLTPTRIKHDHDFAVRPEFHMLIRRLASRVASLSYFHCDQLQEVDFPALVAQAEQVRLARADTRWVDWERYSTRQKQRMNLGGFTGELTYEGDLAPFLPLLALGELLHVGKATAFGHGKYELLSG